MLSCQPSAPLDDFLFHHGDVGCKTAKADGPKFEKQGCHFTKTVERVFLYSLVCRDDVCLIRNSLTTCEAYCRIFPKSSKKFPAFHPRHHRGLTDRDPHDDLFFLKSPL